MEENPPGKRRGVFVPALSSPPSPPLVPSFPVQQRTMSSNPIPYAINRQDDGIRIEWDQSGHEGFFPARDLRLACPCAACVEEMSGRALLDPASIPTGIRPVSIALVGAYGIKIQWSDGHSTGIYTFERLLRSCPCSRCSGSR
jgi:ATP-binding protein involved in chromosome partitioning